MSRRPRPSTHGGGEQRRRLPSTEGAITSRLSLPASDIFFSERRRILLPPSPPSVGAASLHGPISSPCVHHAVTCEALVNGFGSALPRAPEDAVTFSNFYFFLAELLHVPVRILLSSVLLYRSPRLILSSWSTTPARCSTAPCQFPSFVTAPSHPPTVITVFLLSLPPAWTSSDIAPRLRLAGSGAVGWRGGGRPYGLGAKSKLAAAAEPIDLFSGRIWLL
nr:unnamed protein product [Digitaria exilis]